VSGFFEVVFERLSVSFDLKHIMINILIKRKCFIWKSFNQTFVWSSKNQHGCAFM